MSGLKRRAVVLAVVALTTLTGCGSIVARARIASAESSLGAARRAQADTKALYEFTAASIYLEKAREEEAYGRFGNAIEWGGMADDFAAKAKLVATSAESESSAP